MSASGGASLIPDKHTLLEQTYVEAIQNNLSSVQRWTSWKEDHESVKKTLKDLPNKLSHQAVIPFGSKALVRAKIVHTNEIFACIGDGWFIKQSAKDAVDLCDRRIKESESMLVSLEKERDLIKNRQTLPKVEEAFVNDDENEIVEDYDEEKESEWRVRHREMERKYHQELAELRKRREEETPPQTEEELFRRLDMLELEEELNDELERLNISSDSEEDEEDSEEQDESEAENEKKDSQEKDLGKLMSIDQTSKVFHQTSERTQRSDEVNASSKGFVKVQRNTSALEPGQVSFGFTDGEGNEWRRPALPNMEAEQRSVSLNKSGKSVSFASDTSEAEDENDKELNPDIFIRFKHSDNEFQPPSREEIGSGDNLSILSPRDIYTQYKQLMTSSVRKSALKKTSSYDSTALENFTPTSNPFGSSSELGGEEEGDLNETSPLPPRDLSHLPAVLQDVVESSSNSNPEESSIPEPRVVAPDRPVSRFKASRAASRK